MDIWTYMRTIAYSRKNEWLHTVCWGYGSSGCFHDDLSNETLEDQVVTNVDKHSNYAAYAKDLSISMAWGLGSDIKELKEPWTQVFPDKTAHMYFMDFFYNNALIYREVVVNVDGGRCILPLPKQIFDENDEGKIKGYRTNKICSDIMRLVNSFQTSYDYDSYLSRTGIEVVDSYYPIPE